MRLCYFGKDGGPKSRVWGFWLVEIKSLFSIALLRFEDGARDSYHTHAFDAVSWLLRGTLVELIKGAGGARIYSPSLRPIWTPRDTFHQVQSEGRSWALTFRGPWRDEWEEVTEDRCHIVLTHGRKEVA